jgi:hypothetical protein
MATHICASELKQATCDGIELDVPNTRLTMHRNRENKYRVDLHIPMTRIGGSDTTNDTSAVRLAQEHAGVIQETKLNVMEIVRTRMPFPVTLVE